jgi:type I restriction enzyme, S subunit
VTPLGVENGTRLMPKDTILFVVRGMSLKTEFRVGIAMKPVAFGQDCKAIVTYDGINPLFLADVLASRQHEVMGLVDEASHGTGRLQTFLIGSLLVPLPSLPEQRKIAELISTWDEAIATVDALLAALRRRKQGLMQRLLTGQVRFGEFAGSEWQVAKAGDIFGPISVRKNGHEELLSVTQNQGVIPRSMLETRVVMPEGSAEGYKLVESGNFIISLRTFQGGIEYSDYRGLVSPAYTVLKPRLSIKQGFYKYFFKSQEFIGRLSVAVIGIRDGKQISFNDFAAMRLPYPSLAEQERIACVLQTCDDDIAVHERKLALLQQQKKGLMQRLLTGQVRVGVG